uniref:Uncharacterized protein n=1 Tax=Oryza sativa subsp. japonica TaxID=39947 RepID=Q84J72_ORYSJ|nr:unknown protein [Oryza sativa Japonica Group]AAO65884.1 unknown protein [Oryza sativa Japonica Group]
MGENYAMYPAGPWRAMAVRCTGSPILDSAEAARRRAEGLVAGGVPARRRGARRCGSTAAWAASWAGGRARRRRPAGPRPAATGRRPAGPRLPAAAPRGGGQAADGRLGHARRQRAAVFFYNL